MIERHESPREKRRRALASIKKYKRKKVHYADSSVSETTETTGPNAQQLSEDPEQHRQRRTIEFLDRRVRSFRIRANRTFTCLLGGFVLGLFSLPFSGFLLLFAGIDGALILGSAQRLKERISEVEWPAPLNQQQRFTTVGIARTMGFLSLTLAIPFYLFSVYLRVSSGR